MYFFEVVPIRVGSSQQYSVFLTYYRIIYITYQSCVRIISPNYHAKGTICIFSLMTATRRLHSTTSHVNDILFITCLITVFVENYYRPQVILVYAFQKLIIESFCLHFFLNSLFIFNVNYRSHMTSTAVCFKSRKASVIS